MPVEDTAKLKIRYLMELAEADLSEGRFWAYHTETSRAFGMGMFTMQGVPSAKKYIAQQAARLIWC